MATAAEDYLAIAANIRTEIRNETARRAALTAAGNPPPVSYTVGTRGGGMKSVQWGGYLREMLGLAREYEELAAAADPYEINQIAY